MTDAPEGQVAAAYLGGLAAGRDALADHRNLRPHNPYEADTDLWLAFSSGFRDAVMIAARTSASAAAS